MTQIVKNLPEMQETWVEKIPWRRERYPLQCSCLENSMDRRAWWAIVHGGLKELDMAERLMHLCIRE